MSFFCQQRFTTSTGREHSYIAEIRSFVRAANGTGAILRLAVCRLMKATLTGGMLKVAPGQLASNDIRMVAIDMIDFKLVTAWEANTLYGIPYGNTSGMG